MRSRSFLFPLSRIPLAKISLLISVAARSLCRLKSKQLLTCGKELCSSGYTIIRHIDGPFKTQFIHSKAYLWSSSGIKANSKKVRSFFDFPVVRRFWKWKMSFPYLKDASIRWATDSSHWRFSGLGHPITKRSRSGQPAPARSQCQQSRKRLNDISNDAFFLNKVKSFTLYPNSPTIHKPKEDWVRGHGCAETYFWIIGGEKEMKRRMSMRWLNSWWVIFTDATINQITIAALQKEKRKGKKRAQ